VKVAALLLLTACGLPPGPWVVEGVPPPDAAEVVAAVKLVAPDHAGLLAAGGVIATHAGGEWCAGIPTDRVAGCAFFRRVFVRVEPDRGWGPGAWRTALAHELCHQGNADVSGEALFWSEPLAEACAARAFAVAHPPPAAGVSVGPVKLTPASHSRGDL